MALAGKRIWCHPAWFAKHVPDPDIEGQRLEHRLVDEELAAMILPQDVAAVDVQVPVGRVGQLSFGIAAHAPLPRNARQGSSSR
jgi:hypothetical protein